MGEKGGRRENEKGAGGRIGKQSEKKEIPDEEKLLQIEKEEEKET